MNLRSRPLLVGIVSVTLALAMAACGTGPSSSSSSSTSSSASSASSSSSSGAPSSSGASSSSATNQSSAPISGGTFTVLHAADINGFDPDALSVGSYPMFEQIYNTLIQYGPGLKPEPELATTWKWNASGTELTLTLRKGVTFHSGHPFNSAAVAWNIARIQNPKSGANARSLALAITKVLTPSPYTVVLQFTSPHPSIFDLLNMMFIADPGLGNDLTNKDAGTGPFMVKKWIPGTLVQLVKNPHYWEKGLPYLNEVDLKVVSDPSAMALDMQSGQAQAAENVAPQDFTRWSQSKGNVVPVNFGIGSQFYDIVFNTQKAPFNNVKVRQAMSLALNRPRIVKTVLDGLGETACLPWNHNVFAYDATLAASCTFDLTKAKNLLAQAGYPNGFSTTLLLSTGVAAMRPIADIYQSDLAQIGVKVTLQAVDHATWRAALFGHRFDMAVHIYGRANTDPDTMLETAVVWVPNPKLNPAGFNSPTYQKLVTEAGSTVDQAKRVQLYKQIDQLLVTQDFTVPVAGPDQLWATSPKVHGMTLNVLGMVQLKNAWLSK